MIVLDYPGVCDSWFAEYRVKQWFDDAFQEAAKEAKQRFAKMITVEVKCYGGPLHGETIKVTRDAHRFDAFDLQLTRRHDIDYHWDKPITYEPPPEPASYLIETYVEQSGTFQRKMQVAIIEGANLFPREENELRLALEEVPWTIVRPASFLYEFHEWWRQAVYKHTGEFIRCRTI